MIWPSAALARRVVALLLLLALGGWAALEGLARPWTVAGPSMAPTLEPDDRVLVDLWTYRQRPPRPGEIVLLRGPGPDPVWWVKRVAVPPTSAPATARRDLWPGSSPGPTVWVLGDAPARSRDSRHFGPVPLDRLVGRVAWRYWPPSRAGRLDGTAATEPVR